MRLVVGTYILDNVTSTAYEEFVSYYSSTPASYITNADIERWNTRDDISQMVTYSYLSEKISDKVSYSYLSEKLAGIDVSVDLSNYVSYSYLTEKLSDVPELITIPDFDGKYVSAADLKGIVQKTENGGSVGYYILGFNDENKPIYKPISFEEDGETGEIIPVEGEEIVIKGDVADIIEIPYGDYGNYVSSVDYPETFKGIAVSTAEDCYNIIGFNEDDEPVIRYLSTGNDGQEDIIIDNTYHIATQEYVDETIADIDIPEETISSYSYGCVLSKYKDIYTYIGNDTIILGAGTTKNITAESSLIGGFVNNSVKGSYNFVWGRANGISNGDSNNNITYIALFGTNNYAANDLYGNAAHHGLGVGHYITLSNPYESGFGTYNLSRRNTDNFTLKGMKNLYGNNCWPQKDNILFSIGNGKDYYNKHNAFEVRQTGDIFIPYNTNPNYTYNHAYFFNMLCLQDFISYTYENISSGSSVDLSNYVSYSYLSEAISDKVTYSYLSEKLADIVISDVIDLSSYATKTDVSNIISYIEDNELVTANALNELSYKVDNIEIPSGSGDLSNYVSKSELESFSYNIIPSEGYAYGFGSSSYVWDYMYISSIDSGPSNRINLRTNGNNRLILQSNRLYPYPNNYVSLGLASNAFTATYTYSLYTYTENGFIDLYSYITTNIGNIETLLSQI